MIRIEGETARSIYDFFGVVPDKDEAISHHLCETNNAELASIDRYVLELSGRRPNGVDQSIKMVHYFGGQTEITYDSLTKFKTILLSKDDLTIKNRKKLNPGEIGLCGDDRYFSKKNPGQVETIEKWNALCSDIMNEVSAHISQTRPSPKLNALFGLNAIFEPVQ